MKKYLEALKELKKKPYGKAVLFFGFYLIFFIVIAILSRAMGTHPIDRSNYERGRSNALDISLLESKEYSYTYKVTIDDTMYNYVGDRTTDHFEYTYNDREYYTDGSKTYIKEDDWKETDSTLKYGKFLYEDNIYNILKYAYSESTTTYENGSTGYNLLVSSNSLNKVLDNKDTDFDEKPNKMTITTDSSNTINGIVYTLDSYCKNNNLCNNSMVISITYNNK